MQLATKGFSTAIGVGRGTEAEIYEFDLNGYILYRDLIPAGDLQ